MPDAEQPIQHISDTARLAVIYRARESERPDALFRDPFARRLAGDRGEQIAASIPFSEQNTWAWVTRTYLYDQFIERCLGQGVDTVINLAAGLDARPYRMPVPASLRWIEVDLPGILAYKEEILAGDKPACRLERVRLDLADVNGRRALFARLGDSAKKAVIITEGLIIYFTREEVAALANDLAAPQSFRYWILDLASPGLLELLKKNMGPGLGQSAVLKFGPPEGPTFFTAYGWKLAAVEQPLKTAARFKRLSFGMRLAALLPASNGRQGKRPWSGICLFEKSQHVA